MHSGAIHLNGKILSGTSLHPSKLEAPFKLCLYTDHHHTTTDHTITDHNYWPHPYCSALITCNTTKQLLTTATNTTPTLTCADWLNLDGFNTAFCYHSYFINYKAVLYPHSFKWLNAGFSILNWNHCNRTFRMFKLKHSESLKTHMA
jgi:hypothetical protein